MHLLRPGGRAVAPVGPTDAPQWSLENRSVASLIQNSIWSLI